MAIGITKQRVLPEPVTARTARSMPCSASGIVRCCTSNGREMARLASAADSSRDTPSCSNVSLYTSAPLLLVVVLLMVLMLAEHAPSHWCSRVRCCVVGAQAGATLRCVGCSATTTNGRTMAVTPRRGVVAARHAVGMRMQRVSTREVHMMRMRACVRER